MKSNSVSNSLFNPFRSSSIPILQEKQSPAIISSASGAGQRRLRLESSFFERRLGIPQIEGMATEMPYCPVVILGGGISGLMAATYLGQAGLSPIVIEGPNPGGAIIQSEHVRNWPGFTDISGAELIENMHHQAMESGARFQESQIVNIDFSQRPYILTLQDLFGNLHKVQADSIVISMGTISKYLGVPGEQKYWTRGVYNCALCDGPLYKGRSVAVVGGGNSAIVEALYLSNLAKKVTILMRGEELRSLDEATKKELLSRPNVEIKSMTTIESIEGDEEKVTHVILKSNGQIEKLDVDAVFLAIGALPNTSLFQGKLSLDAEGYLLRDKNMQTSMKGVFAIGDIALNHCKQAVCAAGEAAEVSQYVSNFLSIRSHKKGAAFLKNTPDIIEISSKEQFKKELANSSIPIVVDFYATWCGPCKWISPVFADLAKEHRGKVKFLKVDVDILHELANEYKITAMPTFLFFNPEGEVVGKLVGANAAKLKEMIEGF